MLVPLPPQVEVIEAVLHIRVQREPLLLLLDFAPELIGSHKHLNVAVGPISRPPKDYSLAIRLSSSCDALPVFGSSCFVVLTVPGDVVGVGRYTSAEGHGEGLFGRAAGFSSYEHGEDKRRIRAAGNHFILSRAQWRIITAEKISEWLAVDDRS